MSAAAAQPDLPAPYVPPAGVLPADQGEPEAPPVHTDNSPRPEDGEQHLAEGLA